MGHLKMIYILRRTEEKEREMLGSDLVVIASYKGRNTSVSNGDVLSLLTFFTET